MNLEYKRGETIIASVQGDFLSQLTKNNIYFYRGSVQTSFDYSVGRIGEIYYIYIQTEKNPDDYSIEIKNIKYIQGGKVKQDTISKDFKINSEPATISINPGFIITDSNFYFDVKSLSESNLNVNLQQQVLSGNNQGSLIFTTMISYENIDFFELYPNSQRRINVLIDNLYETTIRNIRISSGNVVYNIPSYIIIKGQPPSSSTPQTTIPSTQTPSSSTPQTTIPSTQTPSIQDPPYNYNSPTQQTTTPSTQPSSTQVNPNIDCLNDEYCSGNEICVNNLCIIPPSSIECYYDKDCMAKNEICENYRCVTQSSQDQPECLTSFNCNTGEICQNRKCVPDINYGITCTNDYDCFGSKVCRNNLCIDVPSSTSSPEIPSTQTPSSTTVINGCTGNSDCKGERVCLNNECVYADLQQSTQTPTQTPPSLISSGCLNDNDCKGERICSNRDCVYPEQVLDQEKGCNSDDDCKSNRVCLNKQCVYSFYAETHIDCIWDDNCAGNERCIDGKCVLNNSHQNVDIKNNSNQIIVGEEYSESRDYDIIIGDDGEPFAKKNGEVFKESVSLKTCNELEGEVCQDNKICEGESIRALDNYCCVGSCVKESQVGNNKTLGYVLIGIILFFLLLFLNKYHKTKRKKFSMSELGKNRR